LTEEKKIKQEIKNIVKTDYKKENVRQEINELPA
jgi:hypothetical protein